MSAVLLLMLMLYPQHVQCNPDQPQYTILPINPECWDTRRGTVEIFPRMDWFEHLTRTNPALEVCEPPQLKHAIFGYPGGMEGGMSNAPTMANRFGVASAWLKTSCTVVGAVKMAHSSVLTVLIVAAGVILLNTKPGRRFAPRLPVRPTRHCMALLGMQGQRPMTTACVIS